MASAGTPPRDPRRHAELGRGASTALATMPRLMFEQLNGYGPEEGAARFAQLLRDRADPAWVAAALERLPAPSLAVLGILVEYDGCIDDALLMQLLQVRLGLDAQAAMPYVGRLLREALVAPVLIEGLGRGVALVEPAAATVAARVFALDARPLPAGPFVADPGLDPRLTVAVLASLDGVEVRVNGSGTLNRTSLKRAARQTGLDEDAWEVICLLGLRCGLARYGDDPVLRAAPEALLAVAEGRYDRAEPWQALFAVVGESLRRLGAPVPQLVVSRWVDAVAAVRDVDVDLDAVLRLPGVCAGTVGGMLAVVAAPLAAPPAVAVPPSFEVFLPPECSPADVVRVVGLIELVRLDRVIVGRLTRASVERAAARGATGEELVAVLAAASRAPVPQNVAAAILDWVGGARFAQLADGQVVVVTPADDARARQALAAFAPRALAPGVLLLRGRAPARAIVDALLAHGLSVREVAAAGARPAPQAGAGGLADLVPPALRWEPGPAARVAAWLGGDPGERARPAEAIAAPAIAAPPRPTAALLAEVRGWAQARRLVLPGGAVEALATILASATPEGRRRALRARDIYEMQRVLEATEARPEGGQVAARPLREVAPLRIPWRRDGVLPALQEAAARGGRVVLDLGAEHRAVQVVDVTRRGQAVLLLGADLDTAEEVALDVQRIRGFVDLDAALDAAEAGEAGEAGEAAEAGRAVAAGPARAPGRSGAPAPGPAAAAPGRPWRPRPGDEAPAGHLPCPCGSGRRYRQCCRAAQA